MRIRLVSIVVTALAIGAGPAAAQDPDPRVVVRVRDAVRHVLARSYQGRGGPEQTERFSRKVKLARNGSVSIANIAGDIVVTTGSGDEVSIDAVKRTRGDQSQLRTVHIDVDERGGRVDVRTTHTARNDRVSVDYTIVLPASASVSLHSVSGSLKVTGVQSGVRAETISGNVVAISTPRLELAKSISGNVELSDASTDGDLAASSVSGHVRARNVKARSIQLGNISGDIAVSDATCERLDAKSVSGNLDFSGALARNGRYDLNLHSGTARLVLTSDVGFELNANTFSGSIRSELPLTIGGNSDRRERDNRGRRRSVVSNRAIRATFGDGSAVLTIRTFSGDIVISKR